MQFMGEPQLFATIMLFLLSIIYFAAIWVATYFYKRIKNSALIALICALILLSIWGFIMGCAFLFLSEFFYKISTVFFALAGLFAVLFVDLIWRQRISALRMSIISTISCLVIFLAWFPESVIIIEEGLYSRPHATGVFEIILFTNLIITEGNGFLWLVASALRAPKSTKNAARNLLIAGILLGPCIVLASILVNFIVGLGVSLLAIIILALIVFRNPQLLYILPFKVYRLLVIDAESGISLFSYDWIKTQIDDVLMGGLLQGFQSISHEVLKQGSIHEVRLDSGVLILQREKTVFVGLLSSNTSKFLEECLKDFAEAFMRDLYPPNTQPSPKREHYLPAENLIKKFFSNIPDNR